MENDNLKSETITLTDTKTEKKTEMAVLGAVSHNGADYILVCPPQTDDAVILKLNGESGDDLLYENVTGADELEALAALFMASDDGLTIEL